MAVRRGRPSTYTADLGAEICEALAGEPTQSIIALLDERPDWPSYMTLCRWQSMHPDFGELYRAAARERAYRYQIQADEIAEGPSIAAADTQTKVARDRLRENRRRAHAVHLDKAWSEQKGHAVEVSTPPGHPAEVHVGVAEDEGRLERIAAILLETLKGDE